MIRVRVQHHPSRADLLPALLKALKPLPTEVITHESDPPNPWAGYKLCMAAPPKCSHLLIIQDDAMPVPGFAKAVKEIAKHNEAPVCLFLARLPRDTTPRPEQAMKMHRRYVRVSWRSFMPVVAVLWPIAKLAEFDAWSIEFPFQPGTHTPRSDDAMAGRWKMMTRQTVLATVPSIVQHPDEAPSTIGRAARWGRDQGRVAAFLADDATDYDWSMP